MQINRSTATEIRERVDVMHAAATTGLLAGNGTAIRHALVFQCPTPQRIPEQFADLVEPVFGDDGNVQDWHLSMQRLLALHDESVHDAWSAFGRWRESYVADHPIGDVATIRQLLAWADGVRDVTELHPLNLDATHVSAHDVPRVAWEAHEIELACRQRTEQGLGILMPQRPGVLRGFVVGAEPTVVLSDGTARLLATRDGLVLRDAQASVSDLLVRGWEIDAVGLTALTDDGPRSLANTDGGRLLMLLAPGIVHAAVRRVPLSVIFAPVLAAVREAAEDASVRLAPLWFRTSEPAPALALH